MVPPDYVSLFAQALVVWVQRAFTHPVLDFQMHTHPSTLGGSPASGKSRPALFFRAPPTRPSARSRLPEVGDEGQAGSGTDAASASLCFSYAEFLYAARKAVR